MQYNINTSVRMGVTLHVALCVAVMQHHHHAPSPYSVNLSVASPVMMNLQ